MVSETEDLIELPEVALDTLDYRSVPHSSRNAAKGQPVWRVRFELAHNPELQFGLDINGDVKMGRCQGEEGCVDLSPYEADTQGVSRHHALLRPTETQLFVIDAGSTNGTWHNGRLVGPNAPYSLSNGDLLTLGQLDLTVWIVRRPTGHTAALRTRSELANALTQIARGITSQLHLEDVLNQTLGLAMSLTAADETALWLANEQTNEFYLVAERGMDDLQVRHTRLPMTDTLVQTVIQSGQALHANSKADDDGLRFKTGYLVEAVVHAPLVLGGVTLGVLSAVHRKPGNKFSTREAELLGAIAEFAAIAVQNSRLHQTTADALSRRAEELAVLSSALSHDLRGLLASIIGYSSIMQHSNLEPRDAACVENIMTVGQRTLGLVNNLLDIAVLSEVPGLKQAPCDVSARAREAVEDLRGATMADGIILSFEEQGEPYQIRADEIRLYRVVLNLVDNAIKHTPEGGQVTVKVVYEAEGIFISVRDTGPGVSEEDLPHIFDKYFRGENVSGQNLGIGLGLAMVQATAKAHGGSVTAENATDGPGSIFSVNLPGSLRITQQ